MARIISGAAHAAAIRAEVKAAAVGRALKLAVVQIGNNAASDVYIGIKQSACAEVGIAFECIRPKANASTEEVLATIKRLNEDPATTAILVQKPLPAHLDSFEILSAVAPEKDADGLHPVNMGRLQAGCAVFPPCTPAGIMELLKREGIAVAGKHAVIVGRSEIVGKPLAMMLLQADATVTICHSKTQELPEICRMADILVCAIGKPEFFTRDYIKPHATVIDVGISRIASKQLCGDVAFDQVSEIAGAITPVPGGVGPMTVAMLLKGVLHAGGNYA